MKNVAVIVCFRSMWSPMKREILCAPNRDRLCPQCPKSRHPSGLLDQESFNRVQAFPLANRPMCRAHSPTQNTQGTKTSWPPDSQTKQAERLHTTGSTHVRMSWCLKFWLLSKFWRLSYKRKKIEIRVLLVLKLLSWYLIYKNPTFNFTICPWSHNFSTLLITVFTFSVNCCCSSKKVISFILPWII